MSIFEETNRRPVARLRNAVGASEAASRVVRWLLRLPYLASFAYLFFMGSHAPTIGIVLSVLVLLAMPVVARATGSNDGFWNGLGGDADGDDGDGGCGGGCGGGD